MAYVSNDSSTAISFPTPSTQLSTQESVPLRQQIASKPHLILIIIPVCVIKHHHDHDDYENSQSFGSPPYQRTIHVTSTSNVYRRENGKGSALRGNYQNSRQFVQGRIHLSVFDQRTVSRRTSGVLGLLGDNPIGSSCHGQDGSFHGTLYYFHSLVNICEWYCRFVLLMHCLILCSDWIFWKPPFSHACLWLGSRARRRRSP